MTEIYENEFSENIDMSGIFKNFKANQQDIFFNNKYLEIFDKSSLGKISNFIYKDNKKVFYSSNIIRSINKNFYDLESPYGYSGFLCNTNDKLFVSEAIENFIDYYKKKNVLVFFLRNNPILNNEKIFNHNLLNKISVRKIAFLKMTNNYDYIWNSVYNSKTRNIIRKGKNLFNLIISTEKSDYEDLVDSYLRYMKLINADKLYLFNKQFFSQFYINLINNFKIFKAVDIKDNKLLGSILVLYQYPYAHYFFSTRNTDNNSITPSLIDLSIKYFNKKKFIIYNFGGGNTSFENDTLFKFKKKFSNNDCFFNISYHISDIDAYTDICDKWKHLHPKLIHKHNNKIMKYRFNE